MKLPPVEYIFKINGEVVKSALLWPEDYNVKERRNLLRQEVAKENEMPLHYVRMRPAHVKRRLNNELR